MGPLKQIWRTVNRTFAHPKRQGCNRIHRQMKPKNLYLVITLLGILALTLISQTQSSKTATIESIQQSNFKTTIYLQNKTTELIIFDSPNLNLTTGDKIKFQGKEDIYKNQKQIIVSKISKINS